MEKQYQILTDKDIKTNPFTPKWRPTRYSRATLPMKIYTIAHFKCAISITSLAKWVF